MNRESKEFDQSESRKHGFTPTKTYQLWNRSSRENFYQCSESDASNSNGSTRGEKTVGASSRDMTKEEDALTAAGATKLPNGAYMLNGMELSKEELDFVLENVVSQETSKNIENKTPLSSSSVRQSQQKEASKSSNDVCGRQLKFRKNPVTSAEKVLAKFTTEVQDSSGGDKNSSNDTEDQCSICLSSLHEESSYQTEKESARDIVGSVSLSLCGHVYHACCLLGAISPDAHSIACPNCKTIHGVMTGTQPVGGSMRVSRIRESLPGHPNTKTIVISYHFPHGIQGPEHPNPGHPYHLVGFPRVGYLPDTPKGNKVLSLLEKAFDRRLIFTVGTSATLGQPDCVVWNGIHHKTETTNYGGHGYPDPNYLDNVTMELAAVGVTEDS